MHGVSGPGPAACESCGGAMRKAISAPAILFKGSGWAKKDAQAASKPKPASAAKEGDSSTKEAPTSGSAESKPGSGATAAGDKPATTKTRTD